MQHTNSRITTGQMTVLISALTVILCLVFGAASAFIQKNDNGNTTTWKFPYIYYYEEWQDVPLLHLATEMGKDSELYTRKMYELSQKEPTPPEAGDPDYQTKMERFLKETEDIAAEREYLESAHEISQWMEASLPTNNYGALWATILFPPLFGTEIVTFFFVTEIVLLVLLCIHVHSATDPTKKEQFATKVAVASYLIYAFSFLTLFMIQKSTLLGKGTQLLFSPVTIIGLILGALCTAALFLKKLIGKRQKGLPIKWDAASPCTLLLLFQTILFAVIGGFTLLPVANYTVRQDAPFREYLTGGKLGFFDVFLMTSLESRYDSLEMFLALAGFVSAVCLIGICAKGIYNRIYYLLYGECTYGGQDIGSFQSILAAVLACLMGLTVYALRGVLARSTFLAAKAAEEGTLDLSEVFIPALSAELLPLILLGICSVLLLAASIAYQQFRKRAGETHHI